MKKIYFISILMSIAVFADTSWVTPSNTICKKSKNPTLKGQVLATPRRGYDAFHLKGVRVTVSLF